MGAVRSLSNAASNVVTGAASGIQGMTDTALDAQYQQAEYQMAQQIRQNNFIQALNSVAQSCRM